MDFGGVKLIPFLVFEFEACKKYDDEKKIPRGESPRPPPLQYCTAAGILTDDDGN